MTAISTAPSGPSPSGARLTGDDLQHLVAWYWCLKMVAGQAGIASVEVEAAQAASVDDVVVTFDDGRRLYLQVKATVSAKELANVAWLTTPPKKVAKSLLQQLHNSWNNLGRPADSMELLTGRPLDSTDTAMKFLDRRNRIGAGLRRATTRAGITARRELAEHLGCGEDEVCDLFDSLTIRTGQTESEWLNRVDDVAAAAGVHLGEDSALRGVTAIRDWVKDTRDPRNAAEIDALIDQSGLRAEPARALVVVQALGPSSAAAETPFCLDWVDRFRGTSPETRRGLIDPTGWNSTLNKDLAELAVDLKSTGNTRVVVTGDMRLPCWFALGAAFREVAGFDVAARYQHVVWAADRSIPSASPPSLLVDESLGDGPDVALVVAVSTDGTSDVREALSTNPQIGRLVTLAPAGTPNRQALTGAAMAMATAAATRDWARQNLKCPRIHLVLITPAPFALFLGHLWDRIAATTVYEDLAADGYEPAFVVR